MIFTSRLLIALLLCGFVSCGPANSDKLRIATSANMQYALDSLAKAFTKKTGTAVEAVISSSGILSAQIVEGAPYDLFLAADLEYPHMLHREGFTTAPPRVYAHGKLVLWTAHYDFPESLEWLTADSVKTIAIANPELAPYGRAAMEVLENEQILDGVKTQTYIWGKYNPG